MKINPLIFRAYDLRGVVGKDLTEEVVEHIGKAFGTFLRRRGMTEAIVSRDSRETSKLYSEALIRGMCWTGVNVTDIGMNLVGTFYWSQYHLSIKGGAYVTASHNPPAFNGFKFANDFSETLVTEGMNELRDLVLNEDYEEGKVFGEKKIITIQDVYFNDVLSRLPLSKRFRVVLDPSGTTAGSIVPALLRKAGCEVIEKNCKIISTFFEGAADPTESRIAQRLSREVLEAKADIGFSYDTDGDRIGIVDEKGGVIWNDVLVALFALDVLHEHPGETIMFNTLCSQVVPETIHNAGGKPFMWRTGHSFLKKKNQEVRAAFIGELSGHFFFSRDFYNHDDGIYSTMRLLRYLAKTQKSLSQAVAGLPQYISSPEIKIYVADDQKVGLIKKVGKILRDDYRDARIIDDERAGDGVRFEVKDVMFVIRYSQNGPYLTIKFEAKTKSRYDEIRAYLSTLLRRFSEIDWKSDINVNVEALMAEV